MTELSKLRARLEEMRSYSAKQSNPAEPQPTQDDHDEAAGLALAAKNLAAEYGNDPTNPDFLDHLDALYEGDRDGDEARAYAAALPAPRAGMQLVASKKNPRIRRWIRTQAAQNVAADASNLGAHAAGAHIGGVVGHNAGRMAALATVGPHIGGAAAWEVGSKIGETAGTAAGTMAVHALHNLAHRESHLGEDKLDHTAFAHQHYLRKHSKFVAEQAQKHGVSEKTVAHALAYGARTEHARQRMAPFTRGRRTKDQPVYKRGLSNMDYHKDLSQRSRAAFVKAVSDRKGKE